MPRTSARQQILQALRAKQLDLQYARYFELIKLAMEGLEDSDDSSDDSDSDQMSTLSESSLNESIFSFATSTDATEILTCSCPFIEFSNTVQALADEVEKSRVLFARPKSSRAPQLHLLEEWALDQPDKFRRKLRVDPPVFAEIVNKIINHPIFHNNSQNPQLPVPVQLAIFLNSAGHYGNAATTEDIADWAGVSIGTVYNCHRRVMVAILQHHDDVIHFDPLDYNDQNERERAKDWVEERTCPEWRGGFLSVDGTPFNLFQKPGWHGEGFYDRKSNYSLSAQVVIMPHNLRIVDYVIGVPGSVHDSNAFAKARIARHPQTFLGGNEWIWADSAYGARPWCVVPFKRPAAGGLTGNQKTFNYHLSKVRVRSEHCFGSLKGRFQSLRELRVQIQAQKDLDEVNMWTRCCFILHNMIVDIEEQLGGTGTFDHFAEEARQWGHRVQDSGEGDEDDAEQEGAGDEGFIGSQGQIFRNTLMGQLLRDFNQHTLNSSSVHHNV